MPSACTLAVVVETGAEITDFMALQAAFSHFYARILEWSNDLRQPRSGLHAQLRHYSSSRFDFGAS